VPNAQVEGLKKVARVRVSEFERMRDEMNSDEDGIKGIFLQYLQVVKSPKINKR
jgi:hypothetical protein